MEEKDENKPDPLKVSENVSFLTDWWVRMAREIYNKTDEEIKKFLIGKEEEEKPSSNGFDYDYA